MKLKVGDSVGGIYKKTKDGIEFWELVEDKINKITETINGRTYYTKKRFRPLNADDVDSNTEMQEKGKDNGYIVTREVFCLNEVTRPFAEEWIKWANENMDKAVGILSER